MIIKFKEENRGKWPLGIVKELYPGRDRVVRAVNVRSGKKVSWETSAASVPPGTNLRVCCRYTFQRSQCWGISVPTKETGCLAGWKKDSSNCRSGTKFRVDWTLRTLRTLTDIKLLDLLAHSSAIDWVTHFVELDLQFFATAQSPMLGTYISVILQHNTKAGLCPLWWRRKRPFDVIYDQYKMKQFQWLLCVAKNCD